MWSNIIDDAKQTKFPAFSNESQLVLSESGNIKKCPYCNANMKLISPSGYAYRCTRMSCKKFWAPILRGE